MREAVAMGIQEMSQGNVDQVVSCLDAWVQGTDLDRHSGMGGALLS